MKQSKNSSKTGLTLKDCTSNNSWMMSTPEPGKQSITFLRCFPDTLFSQTISYVRKSKCLTSPGRWCSSTRLCCCCWCRWCCFGFGLCCLLLLLLLSILVPLLAWDTQIQHTVGTGPCVVVFLYCYKSLPQRAVSTNKTKPFKSYMPESLKFGFLF